MENNLLYEFFNSSLDAQELSLTQQENIEGDFRRFIASKGEALLVTLVDDMCRESLGTNDLSQWQAIKKSLFANRKNLSPKNMVGDVYTHNETKREFIISCGSYKHKGSCSGYVSLISKDTGWSYTGEHTLINDVNDITNDNMSSIFGGKEERFTLHKRRGEK